MLSWRCTAGQRRVSCTNTFEFSSRGTGGLTAPCAASINTQANVRFLNQLVNQRWESVAGIQAQLAHVRAQQLSCISMNILKRETHAMQAVELIDMDGHNVAVVRQLVQLLQPAFVIVVAHLHMISQIKRS